jgi:hypothetical protein
MTITLVRSTSNKIFSTLIHKKFSTFTIFGSFSQPLELNILVSIVVRLQAEYPWNQGSIPGKRQLSSSPLHTRNTNNNRVASNVSSIINLMVYVLNTLA